MGGTMCVPLSARWAIREDLRVVALRLISSPPASHSTKFFRRHLAQPHSCSPQAPANQIAARTHSSDGGSHGPASSLLRLVNATTELFPVLIHLGHTNAKACSWFGPGSVLHGHSRPPVEMHHQISCGEHDRGDYLG